jgi:hypothetical protein
VSPADIIEKARRCGVSVVLNETATALSLSAESAPPQDIVDLIRSARDVVVVHLQQQRAIRAWIDENLTTANPGICLHCEGRWLADFESIFLVKCGAKDGFVHEACWEAWEAEQDRWARKALGFA